jgi:hypothetical protein
MNHAWRRLSLGAATALLTAGTGVVLAGAPLAGASGGRTVVVPGATASTLSRAFAPAAATSTNSTLAGYRVTRSAGITSFDVTVKVPTLTCPKSGTYSAYLSSQAVGTVLAGGAFVHFECTSGAAKYAGFITFAEGTTLVEKHFAVAAGHTLESQITVSVAKGKTHVHTMVTNETTGAVTNQYLTYTGITSLTTGWDVMEHLGKAAVPRFASPVPWSGATVNGTTLKTAGASKYTMIRTGTVLVSTSALGATGASFTNKFHASS